MAVTKLAARRPRPLRHIHRAYDKAWYVLDEARTFHLGADIHRCPALTNAPEDPVLLSATEPR